jgi:hypothetical protein
MRLERIAIREGKVETSGRRKTTWSQADLLLRLADRCLFKRLALFNPASWRIVFTLSKTALFEDKEYLSLIADKA